MSENYIAEELNEEYQRKAKLFEPCPICCSTAHIRQVRSFSNRRNKAFCCDKCDFYTPKAFTWDGARRKWNSYVRVYANGYNERKEIIMANLEKEKMKMEHKEVLLLDPSIQKITIIDEQTGTEYATIYRHEIVVDANVLVKITPDYDYKKPCEEK